MKILAIECSGLTASVAIATEETVIAEYTTNHKKTHSQTLMPMIEEIMNMTGVLKESLDAVCVSKGPGSFTGLRIGAASAKGLALALNITLIPVSSLLTMAYNFYGSDKLIVPIMDARRDQVFTAIYSYRQEFDTEICSSCVSFPKEDLSIQKGLNKFSYKIDTVMEDQPLSIYELIDTLDAIGEDVIFLGDGVKAFGGIIDERASFPFSFAPQYLQMPKAGAMAKAALDAYKQGDFADPDLFVPEYYRLSQAEREKEEKTKNDK